MLCCFSRPWRKKIQDQNNTIQDQNNTIDDQSNTIDNQSNTIQDQNNTIQDQNNTINDQNNTIDDQSNTIDDQNNTIDDQSNTIDDQSNTIQRLKCIIEIQQRQIKKLNEIIGKVVNIKTDPKYYRLINNISNFRELSNEDKLFIKTLSKQNLLELIDIYNTHMQNINEWLNMYNVVIQ